MPLADSIPPDTTIYSVSRLNRATRTLFADHFGLLWVEGEISNLAQPSSGHIYFTLKDATAQVRCAMFRGNQRRLSFSPANGDQVIVKAQVSLYEQRGDYQLIVERMIDAGDGALRRAFEALKQQLLQAGWFDAEKKKPLPQLPNQIGVITSPTGAAIHDILTVLRRRFPAIPLIIYPVAVQGEAAKGEIARAIQLADQRSECDLLILARGGGSLEDLRAFNEKEVAEAIFYCSTPIISGIGHEVDVTIADFVADYRAATPSAAAETASPDQAEWLNRFDQLQRRLKQQINQRLNRHQQAFDWLDQRLQRQHPGRRLDDQAQQLDQLELRLKRAINSRMIHTAERLKRRTAQLQQHNPVHHLATLRARQQLLNQRLHSIIQQTLQQQQQRVTSLSHTLNTVSPLATLSRGYSIVTRSDEQKIVTTADQLQPGDQIETRLANGSVTSEVISVKRLITTNP